MSRHNIYDISLEQNRANYEALTPVSFLRRAAQVYPHKTALIHNDIRRTWAETERRCHQLAAALSKSGVGADVDGLDRVHHEDVGRGGSCHVKPARVRAEAVAQGARRRLRSQNPPE